MIPNRTHTERQQTAEQLVHVLLRLVVEPNGRHRLAAQLVLLNLSRQSGGMLLYAH